MTQAKLTTLLVLIGLASWFDGAGQSSSDVLQEAQANNCHQATSSANEYWQRMAHSVVKLRIRANNQVQYCTGVLVNDATSSLKPYILTANHCFFKQGETTEELAEKLRFLEVEFYNDNSSAPKQILQGAKQVLTQSYEFDFALLELQQPVPNYFNPLYAGLQFSKNWEPRATENYASLHHPRGSSQKIARAKGVPQSASYTAILPMLSRNAHWGVNWDKGFAESGSSGAPLFNQQFQVIGTLSGGNSKCQAVSSEFLTNADFFAKMQLAWDGLSEPRKQLKYWLDPEGLHQNYIPHYDPSLTTGIQETADKSGTQWQLEMQNQLLYIHLQNSQANKPRISIYNLLGKQVWTKTLHQIGVQTVEVDFANLTPGIYFVQLKAADFQEVKKITHSQF